jgi:hypothetical protein
MLVWTCAEIFGPEAKMGQAHSTYLEVRLLAGIA